MRELVLASIRSRFPQAASGKILMLIRGPDFSLDAVRQRGEELSAGLFPILCSGCRFLLVWLIQNSTHPMHVKL